MQSRIRRIRYIRSTNKYWADSFTVLLKPAYFVGSDRRFEVQTPDEIGPAMTEIENLFKEHIFPFFDACQDLAAVERLSNPGEHAITGVIAAALCRRSDFPDIAARYRDILAGYVEPIRKKFEAAVAHAMANLLPN